MNNTTYLSEKDCIKIVSQTNMALLQASNSFTKQSPSLVASDIEAIKDKLISFNCESAYADEFKKSVINKLDNFKKNIHEEHYSRICEYRKKQLVIENQIIALENEINNQKTIWPFNAKTKECQVKLESLKAQSLQLSEKIVRLSNIKPQATEKDILMLQIELKEAIA